MLHLGGIFTRWDIGSTTASIFVLDDTGCSINWKFFGICNYIKLMEDMAVAECIKRYDRVSVLI